MSVCQSVCLLRALERDLCIGHVRVSGDVLLNLSPDSRLWLLADFILPAEAWVF